MTKLLRRLYCRLTGGHAITKHCEPPRVFTRCQRCGFESSGWTSGVVQPTPLPCVRTETRRSAVTNFAARARGG